MFGLALSVVLTIRKHWLSVQVALHHGEAVQVAGTAQVAMRRAGKNMITIGIGEEAAAFTNTQDVIIVNAFCHPRVLIAGFDDALIVVREFLQRASGKKRLSFFRLTILVPNDLEGELTDIEERALMELGLRLGARAVSVQPQPASAADAPAL